jgi:hypothetical protein
MAGAPGSRERACRGMIGSRGNLRSSFTFRLLGFRESVAAIFMLPAFREFTFRFEGC